MSKTYALWETHISRMKRQAEKSGIAGKHIKLVVENRPVNEVRLKNYSNAPLPAGNTMMDWRKAWKNIKELDPDVSLSDLLLPAAPVQTFRTDEPSMNEVITDLVFQLK